MYLPFFLNSMSSVSANEESFISMLELPSLKKNVLNVCWKFILGFYSEKNSRKKFVFRGFLLKNKFLEMECRKKL